MLHCEYDGVHEGVAVVVFLVDDVDVDVVADVFVVMVVVDVEAEVSPEVVSVSVISVVISGLASAKRPHVEPSFDVKFPNAYFKVHAVSPLLDSKWLKKLHPSVMLQSFWHSQTERPLIADFASLLFMICSLH